MKLRTIISAGNISTNLQLGIGIVAAFLSTIIFILFVIPGVFNAWQSPPTRKTTR